MRLFESNVKVKNQVDYWLVANSLSCRHLVPRLCLVRKRSLACRRFQQTRCATAAVAGQSTELNHVAIVK